MQSKTTMNRNRLLIISIVALILLILSFITKIYNTFDIYPFPSQIYNGAKYIASFMLLYLWFYPIKSKIILITYYACFFTLAVHIVLVIFENLLGISKWLMIILQSSEGLMLFLFVLLATIHGIKLFISDGKNKKAKQ
jgi:hypothetical protein